MEVFIYLISSMIGCFTLQKYNVYDEHVWGGVLGLYLIWLAWDENVLRSRVDLVWKFYGEICLMIK